MIQVPKDKTLMPFQVTGVELMLNRQHNLLADEMGLGKTVQAIALANSMDYGSGRARQILVVCKASIKYHWLNKFKEWATFFPSTFIVEGRTCFIPDICDVVIVNYDLLTHSYIHHQLMDRQWDLLICDEAHYLKNMQAKRTEAILSCNGLVRRCKRTLMMTGTPVLNRPIELYALLKVLAVKVLGPYKTYFQYGRRYCAGYQDGFQFNVDGASHLEELNKSLRQHYMIRRFTREVQVELPARRHEIIFIDAPEGVEKKLRKLDQANRKDFKYHALGLSGGELATIRRETAEIKVETCLEIIRGYVESAGKLVIFAYHHSVIERLSTELRSFGVVTLTGECSSVLRQSVVEKFQSDPNIGVFIGQIQAAGEGIDGLQRVCSNVLFVETSWVPGEIEQACKRVHRMGQDKSTLFRFLVWANSIEEHMMRVALDKVEVTREILK